MHRIFNKINVFPVSNVQKIYGILIVLMLVCVGCQWHLKPAETDAAGKRIGIQRFDRIEMLYLTTGDYSALQQMNTYFPTETRMLIEDMLHLGQVDDPAINTKFLFFFQDSTLQQMLNDVQQQYANMDDVDEHLSLAFKRLKDELPDMPVGPLQRAGTRTDATRHDCARLSEFLSAEHLSFAQRTRTDKPRQAHGTHHVDGEQTDAETGVRQRLCGRGSDLYEPSSTNLFR